MAILAYDPTRGYAVPINQARVIAYYVDSETGQRTTSAPTTKTEVPVVVTPAPSTLASR